MFRPSFWSTLTRPYNILSNIVCHNSPAIEVRIDKKPFVTGVLKSCFTGSASNHLLLYPTEHENYTSTQLPTLAEFRGQLLEGLLSWHDGLRSLESMVPVFIILLTYFFFFCFTHLLSLFTNFSWLIHLLHSRMFFTIKDE